MSQSLVTTTVLCPLQWKRCLEVGECDKFLVSLHYIYGSALIGKDETVVSGWGCGRSFRPESDCIQHCRVLYSGEFGERWFFYIGVFLIWRYRRCALPALTRLLYWRSFNLAVFTRNCQFAWLKPLPNFPTIQYISMFGVKIKTTLPVHIID